MRVNQPNVNDMREITELSDKELEAFRQVHSDNLLGSLMNKKALFIRCIDFIKNQEKDAIIGLAGALRWAKDNLKGVKRISFLQDVFSHDLSGAKDEFMLPRSDEYKEFFIDKSA